MTFIRRPSKRKYKNRKKKLIFPPVQLKSKIKDVALHTSSSSGRTGVGLRTPSLPGTIDYKNVALLRKFITSQGKIIPRRISKLSAKQQRSMAKAIKNARMAGLLIFINIAKDL